MVTFRGLSQFVEKLAEDCKFGFFDQGELVQLRRILAVVRGVVMADVRAHDFRMLLSAEPRRGDMRGIGWQRQMHEAVPRCSQPESRQLAVNHERLADQFRVPSQTFTKVRSFLRHVQASTSIAEGDRRMDRYHWAVLCNSFVINAISDNHSVMAKLGSTEIENHRPRMLL